MEQGTDSRGPVVVATWPFGLAAAQVAWRVLSAGGAALDAAVEGATHCEDDESVDSVGYGGLPDASGEVTLDASVMTHDLRCGAVACLKRVRHAAKVARLVMEKTPHVLLAGEGATRFALANGFREEDLLSPRAREAWEKWRAAQGGDAARSHAAQSSAHLHAAQSSAQSSAQSYAAQPRVNDRRDKGRDKSHDTIGILALDRAGRLGGACTTSGRAFKLAGRVGDSPIVGAGLYVDGDVGAATATGLGEEVIRVAGSFAVVEQMRRGAEPAEALAEVLRRVRRHKAARDADVSLLALRPDGAWAGLTLRPQTNFRFAVVNAGGGEVVKGPVLPAD